MKNVMLDWLATERRATLFHKEDGNAYIESRQDAEPLIEWVKDRAQETDDKDYKFIGVIPEATLNQAFAEGWFHDQAAWRKWLADNPKFSARWHR
jgi:GTP-dependent phosphoenolpyruvate carboxykinase